MTIQLGALDKMYPVRKWVEKQSLTALARTFLAVAESPGKDFQGHVSHFSRTPFSGKRSLEFMSLLVLPQHEQSYPEGLPVFAGWDKVEGNKLNEKGMFTEHL